VKLWDVRERRLEATLTGHTAGAHALAFSPDGRTLASGSVFEKKIRLWDISSRRQTAVLDEWVTSHALTFSPDGCTLASGNFHGVVKLWQMTGHAPGIGARVVASLPGPAQNIACLAYSPDGRLLASGSSDGTTRLWDVARRREITMLRGHRRGVTSVRFSRDAKRLFTASNDGAIRVWSLATRQSLMFLVGHTNQVRSLSLSPDGNVLASGSTDGTVKLWNPTPKPNPTLLLRQRSPIRALAYSPDGATLAVGSDDGAMQLIAVDAGHRLATMQGHRGPVTQLAFLGDNDTVASLGADRSVKLWEPEPGGAGASRWRMTPLRNVAGVADAIAVSPDGQMLAIGCEDRTLRVWRAPVRRAGDSPLRTAGAGAAGEWLAPLRGFAGPVFTVGFSPAGRMLATGSTAPTADKLSAIVNFWEVGSWRRVGRLNGAPDVSTLRIAPDGRTLVTGSGAEPRMLWSMDTRRAIAFLGADHSGDFAYSPDSHTLAISTGTTHRITLWNLVTGQDGASLRGHQDAVTALAFAPGGDTLASGGADGTIHLWRAPSFQETDRLQAIATGGDRTVRIEWQPLPRALGYDIYRGPAGARRAQLVKLTARPISGRPYTDRGPELVNGRPQTYVVAPIYTGDPAGSAASRRANEAAWKWLQAIPIAAPSGWWGSSINEGLQSGLTLFDPARDEVTLRDRGKELPGARYFLWQWMAGDFQATVKVLHSATGRPVPVSLVASESLDSNSRHASLDLDRALGLGWREDFGPGFGGEWILAPDQLKLPILLRLRRHGNTIFASCSEDNGQRFHRAVDSVEFAPALAQRLHVGMVVSRSHPDWTGEARCSRLEIQKQ
jgi:WD40 repeat protein